MKRRLIAPGMAASLLGLALMVAPRMTVAAGAGTASFQAGEGRPSMPLPLKVAGTQVVNGRGERVRLRGVNAAALEWSSNGEGHIVQTVTVAIRDWHVNHVRLPLAQDRWFGKAPEQEDGGEAYRALVRQVVDLCAAHGCYILLDLHWSDRGVWGQDIGQHVMPDRNSLAFWKEVATIYKDHPAVLFDLYNEPHDVSWDVWRDGGRVTEKGKGGQKHEFEAVGMQAMLDTVRATGAKNVVVVGGLDWAYDLSGFLKGYQLVDRTGHGIIYANHAYPFKGDSVEKWLARMEAATKTLPVIVSEFGPPGTKEEPWLRRVLQILEDHKWDWTAWDLHPAASPCLVKDWKYTPTSFFGRWVKLALEDRLPRYSEPPEPARNKRTSAPSRGAISPMAGLMTGLVPGGGAAAVGEPVGIFEGHRDVGDVRHPGSIAFDRTAGTYTVAGSGANMWQARDAFHYAWKRIDRLDRTGVTFAADIAFVGQGKEPHRKACLIFRQDLDADSAYVDAAVHGDGLTSLQFRDSKGDLTHEVQANVSAPKRVGLVKKENYVQLFVDSGKGMAYSGAAVRIELRTPFYVGIGVCSHNAESTERAVFSNVELDTRFSLERDKAVLHSTLETMSLPSTDRRVVYVIPARIEAPNWLHDGRTLIYNRQGLIFRIPASGGTPEVIDTGFANRCNNDHGVSPDGRLLAISDQSQGKHQSLIYTLPVTGGKPTLVAPTGPSYWHGWSPDGRTLAYCGDRGGEFDIYTIPVEGGTETRLTTARGLDDGPEYSPDGRWIYFNSDRTGTMQIYRMRPDGSEQEALTADGFNNWFAHPSPDGRVLVFLSYEKDVTGHPANKDVTLRRMNLADRKIDVLARFFGGQGTINVPCWSPDGREIAFVTYQIVP